MKRQLLAFSIVLLASGLWSCRDKCKETRVEAQDTPITHSFSEIRNSVKSLPGRDIQDPGKMIVKGNYLFINEIKQGVHVIDNSDPSSPKFVSFIQIPGNGDIAVRENILIADSYCDLASIDITDPANAKEVGRLMEVYNNGWFNNDFWSVLYGDLFLNEFSRKYVTVTVDVDCENNIEPIPEPSTIDQLSTSTSPYERPKVVSRFALKDNFLYTVLSYLNLGIFNIINPILPVLISTIYEIDPNPASIFIGEKDLFIASYGGTMVYDNSDPSAPHKVSALPKGTACDKTVAWKDVAYVISRSGTYCGNLPNKLDLIDLSDRATPSVINTYSMTSPRNLAIDYPTLYVCEGANGFKVFDVSDKMAVDKHLLTSNKDLKANDVILSGKIVIVNAEDGIYQFDASDPKNLKQLSKIFFKKAV